MEEQFTTSFRCWNCSESLIKSNGDQGVIKSKVLFFEKGQLLNRCRKCGSNNVLPYKISPMGDPTLAIFVKKDSKEALQKSQKTVSLNVKGKNLKRGKGPGSKNER